MKYIIALLLHDANNGDTIIALTFVYTIDTIHQTRYLHYWYYKVTQNEAKTNEYSDAAAGDGII